MKSKMQKPRSKKEQKEVEKIIKDAAALLGTGYLASVYTIRKIQEYDMRKSRNEK